MEVTHAIDFENEGCNDSEDLSSEDTEDIASNHCLNIAIEYYLIIAKSRDKVSYNLYYSNTPYISLIMVGIFILILDF
jgi:hypothetical protein